MTGNLLREYRRNTNYPEFYPFAGVQDASSRFRFEIIVG